MSEKPPFELTPEQLHGIAKRHEQPWDTCWTRQQVFDILHARTPNFQANIEDLQDQVTAAEKVLEAFERYQWNELSDSALRYLTWEMIQQAKAERTTTKGGDDGPGRVSERDS